MIRGLYTSALGMTTQMKKMDIISNNIANINTTGYKKDVVITQSFTEELTKRLNDRADIRINPPIGKMTHGVFVDTIYSQFSNGSLQQTDAPLDIAISGDGFFAVNFTDNNGAVTERYTRDGAFSLSTTGQLVTREGYSVLGQNGAITLPDGDISIDETGRVYSAGEYVDTLRLVNFNDSQTLRKTGDNMFTTTNDSQVTPFTGNVVQGFIENSNVNSVKELVDLITVNRNYEANQKMISYQDTLLGRAVSEIARK